MGMISKGAEKARTRQRDGVIQEAQRAGTQVVGLALVGDEPSTKSTLGSIATAFVGGKASADDAQIFTFDTQGFRHTYLQPYDGMNAIPGLHSAIVPGSVPQSAALVARSLGRHKWIDCDEKAVDALDEHPTLKRAIGLLEWKWRAGTTEISLPWTLQFRPTGNGTTEILLRTGRYGGTLTYGVGVSVFLEMARVVHTLTSPAAVGPQPFVVPIG